MNNNNLNGEAKMKGMKRKTIRKVLRSKIEDWLKSIENKEARDVASKGVIVTGGSIASMLMGDPINDFDIYMRDKESCKTLANFYVTWFNELNKDQCIIPIVQEVPKTNLRGDVEDRVVIHIKSSGVAGEETNDGEYQYYEVTDNIHGDGAAQYIETAFENKDKDEEDQLPRYRPVFLSQNAITLKNKVQFVIRFYGEPDKIHDNYDFLHATCYYDYAKDELVMPSEALESMMSKTLIYRGSLYPICSLIRMKKFLNRGWTCSAGQILKMCYQVGDIDFNDIEQLKEQLTGVDQAYFIQVIRIIESEMKKKELLGEKTEIDSAYLIQVIDKIFGE